MAISPLSVPRTAKSPDVQIEQRGKVTANQNLGEGAKENSPLEYSPAQVYLIDSLCLLTYVFSHILHVLVYFQPYMSRIFEVLCKILTIHLHLLQIVEFDLYPK